MPAHYLARLNLRSTSGGCVIAYVTRPGKTDWCLAAVGADRLQALARVLSLAEASHVEVDPAQVKRLVGGRT